MKMILLFLGLLFSHQSIAQDMETQLVKHVWGEVTERIPRHRGKAGLILLDFKADHSFRSYETTSNGDNVLQIGTWELKNNILTFEVDQTKHYQKASTRNGKILPSKQLGLVSYTITKLEGDHLVLEHTEGPYLLQFKTMRINYIPKE